MSKKSIKEICGFDDWRMIAVGLPLASIMGTLLLFNQQVEQCDWYSLGVCFPAGFLHTAAFWFSLRWAYLEIRSHFPDTQELPKRLALLFGAFVVMFFVIHCGLEALFEWLSPQSPVSEPSLFMSFISSLILSALVITLYEAISFYIKLQQTVAEKNQLERQNVESQLEGLRNQVNPHFLFNSLNTLAYLIPEDADKAVRFLQQLSNVYRYVLESREAKIIPLSKELEFLDAYVFLLKERFGENLQVKVKDLEGKSNYAIVPLSLQMLFENAIKHNVLSVEKPLSIEVFAENGHLVIRNNLQKKNQVMDSTGVGLQNIRDRYRMLTKKEVEVIASQQYFTVALPIIEVTSTENPSVKPFIVHSS